MSPDWNYWANLALVDYGDACALSMNLSPKRVRDFPLDASISDELRRREQIASSHLHAGTLSVHAAHRDDYAPKSVKLAEFRAWGESLPQPLTFPDEFPRVQIATPSAPTSRWPWGEHETDLLRHLAAAAKKFWQRYDPTDATTAPKNEVVVEYLKEKGVAERNAQVMATILRADDLPTGPRK